jgi:hypothetical protein
MRAWNQCRQGVGREYLQNDVLGGSAYNYLEEEGKQLSLDGDLLTRDQARRIGVNIAKLSELVRRCLLNYG